MAAPATLAGSFSHSGRAVILVTQFTLEVPKLMNQCFFSPTATSVAQGSLAQITFGAIRCSFNARIRMVPVQRLGEVPEGSGAHTQVRFRKVPVQRLGEVPEGSGSDFR